MQYDAEKIENSVTPLISIIIPVYRVERYILRCLKSVKQQNFDEMEVILVDDCGDDNSIPIAKKFIAGDPRFRIIRNEKNLSLGPARDRGLKKAIGKYIFFLDSDDYLAPGALQKIYGIAEKTQADVIAFQMLHLHKFTKRIYPEFSCNVIATGKEFLPAFLMTRNSSEESIPNIEGYECNKLFRRTLLTENHIHHLPQRVLGEDFYFIIQVLFFAKKVICIPETLYFYDRRNSSSLTAQTNLDFFATCFLPIVESKLFLQKHGEWSPWLEKRFLMHIYRFFYFETLIRLSFFSNRFNRKLISVLSDCLTKYQLWQEDPALWNGFEPFFEVLCSNIKQLEWPFSFYKLKLLKLKVYYIPLWLVRLKKKFFPAKN